MGSAAKNNILTSGIESDYNLNKQLAKNTEADAIFNADQRRKEGLDLLKNQVAAFGASGVELEGTPMELMKRDQEIAEAEALNIIYSGKSQAAEIKAKAKSQKRGAYLGLGMQAASMGLSSGAFSSSGATAGTIPQGTSATNYNPGLSSSRNIA